MEFEHIRIWRNIVSLPGKPDSFMIDLMNADSNYLKNVIARSIEIQYEGVSIPVVSIEDLIILKLFSFRKQDQIDIENLILSGTPISWEYLKSNIESFQLDWHFIEQIQP